MSVSTSTPFQPISNKAQAPKLLDRLADALHQRNYIPALIHDYVDWARRYIFFHNKQYPGQLGIAEVTGFIDYLAGDGGATSFQRAEAERALRFLYAVVLEKVLPADPRSAPETFRVAANQTEAFTAPKLLEQMREVMRVRHYARRTEDCYVDWATRYILFHGKKHPAALGANEVSRFLTHLAVDGKVAASTQNQAFSAIELTSSQAIPEAHRLASGLENHSDP